MSGKGMITSPSRQQKIRMLLDELDAALRDLRANMSNSGIDAEDALGRLLGGLEVCFRISAAIAEESHLSAAETMASALAQTDASIEDMMKKFSEMLETASKTTLTRDQYLDKIIRTYEYRLKAMYIGTDEFRNRVFEEFQSVFREQSAKLREELSRGFKLYHWYIRRIHEWKWVAGGAAGMFVVMCLGRIMGFAL